MVRSVKFIRYDLNSDFTNKTSRCATKIRIRYDSNIVYYIKYE